jgi:Right handed beta helix region
MRYSTWCASLLGIALLLGVSAGSANAQATRTWVSGVGDDANPCSRTAPCKTFAGAISKTAAGGEIDCLDPGGFGAVTITKAITLDCAGGQGGQVGSILSSGVNGIVISGTPGGSSVTIRNMSINGAGSGLNGIRYISGGGALHVENVEIFGFTQKGIDFENTASANLFVRSSQISDNLAGGGILVKPAGGVLANVSLYQVRLDRNLFGLRVEDGGKATVEDCVAHSNSGNGFLAVSSGIAAEINLVRSVASNTVTNGVATSGTLATITMSYSAVTDNGTGINTLGGGTVKGTSPGTNTNSGNGTPGAPNGAALTLQ